MWSASSGLWRVHCGCACRARYAPVFNRSETASDLDSRHRGRAVIRMSGSRSTAIHSMLTTSSSDGSHELRDRQDVFRCHGSGPSPSGTLVTKSRVETVSRQVSSLEAKEAHVTPDHFRVPEPRRLVSGSTCLSSWRRCEEHR